MYINETKVKVRYVETDQMGIVHHSNYYAWFEVGRGEYITQIGMTYSEMEENNIMIPVLESSCKYICKWQVLSVKFRKLISLN
ncbi:acyl-CoA thioesterase, partial [Clostridium sp.]